MLPTCSTSIKQHIESRAVDVTQQQPNCHFALALLVDLWSQQWDGATPQGNDQRRRQADNVAQQLTTAQHTTPNRNTS